MKNRVLRILKKLIWSEFHVQNVSLYLIQHEIFIYIISQPSIMLLKFMLNEVILWLFYLSTLDSDLIISASASSNVRNNYFCNGKYFHLVELWAICELYQGLWPMVSFLRVVNEVKRAVGIISVTIYTVRFNRQPFRLFVFSVFPLLLLMIY